VVEWLDQTELRIGLGCMRLPADEAAAAETIRAALDAGVTILDTAHAYGGDRGGLGGNERLVASVVRADREARRVRIVTKGGMTRPGGAWVPDGRAKAIASDAEASLAALEGLPIDLYLLHAPDPRTPWPTSVRALARLVDGGLVARVGLANVNRTQLDEAIELAPIAAVQVALNPFDDRVLRGGVLERCDELGLALIAHSPLGGPRRVAALARRSELAEIAARNDSSPEEIALVWLLDLSPNVVAIPGASRPQTARSAARAVTLELSSEDRASLRTALGGSPSRPRATRTSAPAGGEDGDEIVIVMGIAGAGKSRLAAEYVARGYARLNRDERGGSLRALAADLESELSAGGRRAILDNTYLTRAARSEVIEIAHRHSLAVRCVWLDTPLAQAQVNLVERLLERFGSLPTPEQIRAAARREPWLMLPTSQMRTRRELEPPAEDEGFSSIERVEFTRTRTDEGQAGVFVGAAATTRPGIVEALGGAGPSTPHLLFDWTPDADAGALQAAADRLASAITGVLELASCPHPGGPPTCWCRPPLPGLPLAFARARSINLARSTLIGCTSAHRTLAATLGTRYLEV
jgi:aryl-alcohol dehydrogenase-like predicted oxidoreductase/adenylate kinase family enzyme